MKRFLTASVATLVLIASQAAAALPGPGLATGDRAGARSETANEFAGIPLPVLLLTVVIIGGFIWGVSDDGPSSP